jgi:hypothetical protein
MNLFWIVTGASLLLALLAWTRARRTARRLEQLSQMYWELKYQHGELRVQVQRMSGESPASGHAAPPPPPADSFIPLASLKK